jgi:DNA-binding transcriptional ArsR family regulator
MLSGWTIARSLALELDVALRFVDADEQLVSIPPGLRERFGQLGEPWRSAGGVFGVGAPVLGLLATLADTFTGDDFSAVTLPMRELTADVALDRLRVLAHATGIELGEVETVDAAAAAFRRKQYAALGVERTLPDDGFAALPDILYGGDRHARFWQWIDEFYYRAYEPWRRTREGAMQAQRARAEAALGAARGDGRAPATEWLAGQNPLRTFDTVRDGDVSLRVVFWVQPLGMWDLWTLGVLGDSPTWVVSFGDPGPGWEHVRDRAENLAERASALGDPTRLLILRIIREMETDSSQIARMLDLARPTVSIHAKQLREAGLIQSRKEGRRGIHSVCRAEVDRLFQDLRSFLGLPAQPD